MGLMHTVLDPRRLADQRTIERRACPPPVVHATQADKIKAEGEKKRREYRRDHPDADTAMTFGAQVGYLHGEIVRLCNELDQHKPTRDKNLIYAELYCAELECDVLVGFDYSAGEDSQTSGPPENCYEGAPEELNVCEVWAGGFDIAPALMERVIAQLTEAALKHIHDEQESAQAEWAERRCAWDDGL